MISLEHVSIFSFKLNLEFGSEDNAYDEDDGETSTYYLPGVYEGRKSSKSAHKKHKQMMKSYTPRPCDVGADLPYGNYTTGPQPSMLNGKRPASLNVGPITKRMRTASRQRVVSPFTAGVTGTVQAQVKTDGSSGDTNSFQDDQSTLHGGSQIHKSVEVESIGEFERQLQYDCAETSVKPKKKKKAKNLVKPMCIHVTLGVIIIIIITILVKSLGYLFYLWKYVYIFLFIWFSASALVE